MLDENSIAVISRFKSALLTKAQKPTARHQLGLSNRGQKLPSAESNPQVLKPKVVEYDGSNHLVLTNDVIERTNYTNKRRWSDFYRSENATSGQTPPGEKRANDFDINGYTNSDYGENGTEDSSENEDEDFEENPLKRMRLSEILAPLAHPSEVASHPAISKTYKSANLAVMAAEIIEIIEVEQNTLNHYNKLLHVLDGEDWYYQLEENMDLPVYDHGLDDTQTPDGSGEGAEFTNTKNTESATKPVSEPEDTEFENKRITRAAVQPEAPAGVTDPFFALPKSLALYERQQQQQQDAEAEAEDAEDEYSAIQQELINYLQVSIQRQHEYIKNLTTIRNGLVKADRYKRDLLRWGKEMGEKRH